MQDVFSLGSPKKTLKSDITDENGCSCNEWRQLWPGLPVHGFLPGAGQQGTDLQLHPQCWPLLHIFLGHQGKWLDNIVKEEEDSINLKKKFQEKGRVSGQETLSSTWDRAFCGKGNWTWRGEHFPVWPMWEQLQIWKRLEDPHWKNSQEGGLHLGNTWTSKTTFEEFSEPLRLPPLGHQQGGVLNHISRACRTM